MATIAVCDRAAHDGDVSVHVRLLPALAQAHNGNATTPSSVTSVQSYCGLNVADDGTIINEFSDECAAFFPAAAVCRRWFGCW